MASWGALVLYDSWNCALERGHCYFGSGVRNKTAGEYTEVGRVDWFAVNLAVVWIYLGWV